MNENDRKEIGELNRKSDEDGAVKSETQKDFPGLGSLQSVLRPVCEESESWDQETCFLCRQQASTVCIFRFQKHIDRRRFLFFFLSRISFLGVLV